MQAAARDSVCCRKGFVPDSGDLSRALAMGPGLLNTGGSYQGVVVGAGALPWLSSGHHDRRGRLGTWHRT